MHKIRQVYHYTFRKTHNILTLSRFQITDFYVDAGQKVYDLLLRYSVGVMPISLLKIREK